VDVLNSVFLAADASLIHLGMVLSMVWNTEWFLEDGLGMAMMDNCLREILVLALNISNDVAT